MWRTELSMQGKEGHVVQGKGQAGTQGSGMSGFNELIQGNVTDPELNSNTFWKNLNRGAKTAAWLEDMRGKEGPEQRTG